MASLVKRAVVPALAAAVLTAGGFAQDKASVEGFDARKQAGPVPYQNDFEKAELGKVPDDLLVLEGAFAVQSENGNRFLELPGAPLETFGVLFGPAESSDVMVSARIFGTGKGRRAPVFGVGLGGVGGYRLLVAPAKKQVELYKGDEMVAGGPCVWESGAWTLVRLQVRKVAGAQWTVEGKIWKGGIPEPAEWTLSFPEKTEPVAGRAAIWGSPFSGTPIRFDDLLVGRALKK